APFAGLFSHGVSDGGLEPLADDAALYEAFSPVQSPKTLATAIKIGSPVSWKKALRAVRQTGGCALSVSEEEIADAKAVIGRDGVGCEPASATTVAGIRRLVAAGVIGQDESVVAVLTGHVLKDADYVISYHSGTLFLHDADDGHEETPRAAGRFANPPARVEASKTAILEHLKRKTEKRVQSVE
ncbi:MAG TPA: pyridoxal-phosphate dependent enzyme, partial [Pyrinomonadaceae bacterium]